MKKGYANLEMHYSDIYQLVMQLPKENQQWIWYMLEMKMQLWDEEE